MSTYTAPMRWPLRSRDRVARPSGRPRTVRLRDAIDMTCDVGADTERLTYGRRGAEYAHEATRGKKSPSGFAQQESPHIVTRRREDSLKQAVWPSFEKTIQASNESKAPRGAGCKPLRRRTPNSSLSRKTKRGPGQKWSLGCRVWETLWRRKPDGRQWHEIGPQWSWEVIP